MNTPPRRTVVAHPQTLAARRHPGRSAHKPTTNPPEAVQDELDALLLRTLVRAQLSLALRLAAIFGCLLGGLPLLLAVSATARNTVFIGLPLPWLLLGVVMYPLLWAGGWVYVRQAERNEQDYRDLVDDTR